MTDWRRAMPALFTTASIRERLPSACRTWVSSLTSQRWELAKGAASRSRAVMLAPSASAARAMASPSPEAAPVTTTCFPENRMPRHNKGVRGAQPINPSMFTRTTRLDFGQLRQIGVQHRTVKAELHELAFPHDFHQAGIL